MFSVEEASDRLEWHLIIKDVPLELLLVSAQKTCTVFSTALQKMSLETRKLEEDFSLAEAKKHLLAQKVYLKELQGKCEEMKDALHKGQNSVEERAKALAHCRLTMNEYRVWLEKHPANFVLCDMLYQISEAGIHMCKGQTQKSLPHKGRHYKGQV